MKSSMKTTVIDQDLKTLFVALHESGLFPDGKEISDAELKFPPEEINAVYLAQKEQPGFDLLEFYQAHFEKAPELESGYVSDTNQPVEQHIEKLWDVLTPPAETEKKLLHPHFITPPLRRARWPLQ